MKQSPLQNQLLGVSFECAQKARHLRMAGDCLIAASPLLATTIECAQSCKRFPLKLLLAFAVFSSLTHAKDPCQGELFTLALNDTHATLSEILGEFSASCGFSVIATDAGAAEQLARPLGMLNLKDATLFSVLELLFSAANLHYSFQGGVLSLSKEAVRTFDLNYLNTARIGTSSTSVTLNNDEQSSSRSRYYADTTDAGANKSGTQITSEDGFNLWENIATEVAAVANKPPDAISINSGAGLLSVRADALSTQKVARYLAALHARLQRQVLIDVQILSVRHSRSETLGINWDGLYNLQNVSIKAAAETPVFGSGASPGNTSGLSIFSGSGGVKYGLNVFSASVSLNRIVEYLRGFGSVSALSNPKITTLNNQPALISVGDILRYRRQSVYENTNAQTTNTNTNNDYPSIFAGVLLDITPLVFGDEIMLKINPSITRTKDEQTKISALAFDAPPNLTTNQLSSMVRVKNGQRVILGGLIAKNTQEIRNGVPLLGDLPLLKLLFSHKQSVENTEEILFVITPRIVEFNALDQGAEMFGSAENERVKFTLEALGYESILLKDGHILEKKGEKK